MAHVTRLPQALKQPLPSWIANVLRISPPSSLNQRFRLPEYQPEYLEAVEEEQENQSAESGAHAAPLGPGGPRGRPMLNSTSGVGVTPSPSVLKSHNLDPATLYSTESSSQGGFGSDLASPSKKEGGDRNYNGRRIVCKALGSTNGGLNDSGVTSPITSRPERSCAILEHVIKMSSA